MIRVSPGSHGLVTWRRRTQPTSLCLPCPHILSKRSKADCAAGFFLYYLVVCHPPYQFSCATVRNSFIQRRLDSLVFPSCPIQYHPLIALSSAAWCDFEGAPLSLYPDFILSSVISIPSTLLSPVLATRTHVLPLWLTLERITSSGCFSASHRSRQRQPSACKTVPCSERNSLAPLQTTRQRVEHPFSTTRNPTHGRSPS